MKILLITPTFSPSVNGLANVVFAYADDLQRRGHFVEVFTPGEEDYEFNNIKVKCLPIKGSFRLNSPVRGPLMQYIDYLKRHDADIAICHTIQTVALDLALLYFNGMKVYHSHGISWRSGLSNNLLRNVMRRIIYLPYEIAGPFLLRKADAAIFLGKNDKTDRTFDVNYIKNKPTVVIENASYFKVKEPKRYTHGKKLRILIVGSCTREKGFELLGELIPLLSEKKVECITVCTIKNSNYYNEFIDKIKSFEKLTINIIEDQYGNDLEKYYENADFLLNLSISECYPLIMADAVNARIPTICFNTGYQSEITGSIIFNDIYEIEKYINNSEQIWIDLQSKSNQTRPVTWESSSNKLNNFLISLERER